VQKNCWLLPGQVLPAGLCEASDPCDLELWFAPLREKYPQARRLMRIDRLLASLCSRAARREASSTLVSADA
jgi:hypothetical protein